MAQKRRADDQWLHQTPAWYQTYPQGSTERGQHTSQVIVYCYKHVAEAKIQRDFSNAVISVMQMFNRSKPPLLITVWLCVFKHLPIVTKFA